MSAYFVKTSTIDRVLTAWRTARAVVALDEMPTAAECTKIGRVLLRENARSMCARYASVGADGCREMETVADSYRYDCAAHPVPAISDNCDPMEIRNVLFNGVSSSDAIKAFENYGGISAPWAAASEYDYQAGETADYRQTPAGEFVKCLEAECLIAFDLMRPSVRKAAQTAEQKKREAEAASLKAAVARLIEENPHLIPGGREVVEKNMRAALKLAFPGVKFSVRKRDYSATSINWTDGPTISEVEAISNRYESGHFDSSNDCYEYRSSSWNEAFGGVRYVSASRDYSDAATLAAIERVAERYNTNPIGIDDYRRNGWNLSPMSNAFDYSHMWSGLVNAVLENKDRE